MMPMNENHGGVIVDENGFKENLNFLRKFDVMLFLR
jgi:hypothetical protein